MEVHIILPAVLGLVGVGEPCIKFGRFYLNLVSHLWHEQKDYKMQLAEWALNETPAILKLQYIMVLPDSRTSKTQ